ncbi:uncharacterized protein BJX67DRAFT_281564 [Aspergillus lucknowensis]|uniref:Uncharacterized protein n=1 Tax=Aspergillus lucknowensis TaxID=176173 RepID=A0ABR4M168_9EURO
MIDQIHSSRKKKRSPTTVPSGHQGAFVLLKSGSDDAEETSKSSPCPALWGRDRGRNQKLPLQSADEIGVRVPANAREAIYLQCLHSVHERCHGSHAMYGGDLHLNFLSLLVDAWSRRTEPGWQSMLPWENQSRSANQGNVRPTQRRVETRSGLLLNQGFPSLMPDEIEGINIEWTGSGGMPAQVWTEVGRICLWRRLRVTRLGRESRSQTELGWYKQRALGKMEPKSGGARRASNPQKRLRWKNERSECGCLEIPIGKC